MTGGCQAAAWGGCAPLFRLDTVATACQLRRTMRIPLDAIREAAADLA
jgi:hypothetical protein